MSWIEIGGELIQQSSITKVNKYEKGGDYYINITISHPVYTAGPNLLLETYHFSCIKSRDRRFKFNNKKVWGSYYRELSDIVKANVVRIETPPEDIILLDD